MSAPISGWRRMVSQSCSVSTRPALHHPVGEAEPPDVVQQAGGVRELAVALGHPLRAGDVAREGGDRGGVARRARVAQVERADQAGQHSPGQGGVLGGAVAGGHDQARHVGEGQDRHDDEDRRPQPELGVDAGRGHRQDHVDRDRGDDVQPTLQPLSHRVLVQQRAERRHDQEVDRQVERGEQAEQQVEADAGGGGEGVEEGADEDGWTGVADEVDAKGGRAISIDQPRSSTQRRRRLQQQARARGRPTRA